uniref:NAB domain-containing protein n=1 Tax=Cajanus cajan TaxID=3821 RepID=A0A151QMY1_CAJCA|nr:hypothetical protein KK1_047916 [Cajanus cajan]
MDVKVKQMIKLIEEDADSFARRAEMYYKKRPELMKMVEEFYRAYRALAERYDHATGVIRHAHKTMTEAFPNQVPMMLTDDLPTEPLTPDMRHPSRAFLDPDEPQKDASARLHAIKRNGAYSGEPDSAMNKTEILALKKAIAKLEEEKEAGLLQYQQSLEKLSNLESEVSSAQANSQRLDERASKAEAEVQASKEALIKLQAESEACLLQYQECLEKISNLEKNISSAQKEAGELNDRATTAENETESLKQELARVEAEKEATLVQYKECLETISKLEERLAEAEENARRIKDHANITENEIEALKLEVTKLNEEKEDAAIRYQQCLEIISSLEYKLSCAEEEVRRLKSKIDDEVQKLQSSEQKCLLLETSNHSMQSELQSLAQKMESNNEEINEKQKELNRLWGCIQEERLRFIEAETAFQTLQQLHSQSQEELRSLAADFHSKVEILGNVESQELLVSLYSEREEHSRVLKLNEDELAEKESQIHTLQEDANCKEKEYEEELDRTMHAQIEIFILQKCINDLEKKNFSLLVECQRLLEASKMSDRMISKLESENVQKQVDVNSLSEKIKILRIGLIQVLKTLDINGGHFREDMLEEDQMLLNHIYGKLQERQESFDTIFNESQQMAIENSVLITFLEQLKLKVENLVTQRDALDEEFKICVMIHEIISQSNSSLIYQNIIFEKHLELKELGDNLDKHCSENNDLEERLKVMVCKLENAEMENSHLKESFIKSNVELNLVESINHQLSCQISDEREMLHQKENELLEAAEMFHKDRQNEELTCLCEVNQKLESEMGNLRQELGETQLREKKLSYEVLKGINEIEQWETQASTLFAELQISAVNETLFEGKVRELADACKNLERRNYSQDRESEQMKERVSKLEVENGRLCDQLAAYVLAVGALNDCITSLEMQTLAHAKPHDCEESKVKDLVNNEYSENGHQTDEDQTVMAPDALPDFQNMQRRINAIAMAVKQLSESFKPKNETREIQASKHVTQARPDIPITEIEVLPKDIMLDQISESSSYGINSTVEKELSVDKLEISRRLTLPREEGNQSKILERLDSDAQKLTNLQITTQDLMKKIEINEKNAKGKGGECDEVKRQLQAAQDTITKLLDVNRKLMKNVEEGSLSSVGKGEAESDGSGSVSRSRVSEQARRESEKIGQLHLEVQRLQFLLLKLGDGKESKEITKVADRNPRVLLRDYLYGGTKAYKKKKRLPFCACMRPSTRGD